MLARYRMLRGKRPADEPLPDGVRQDSRHRTRHCLRPASESVTRYLAEPNEQAWRLFEEEYESAVKARFEEDRAPFDQLAELAATKSVYLGCNCPTKKNPDVRHCHTVLALRFMADRYPELKVVFPD